MGYFGSIFAWMMLIFCIAAIVFLVFMFILGWVYPQELIQPITAQIENTLVVQEESIEQRQQMQRKWIGIFVLIALILIMTGTGLSALMGEITKP